MTIKGDWNVAIESCDAMKPTILTCAVTGNFPTREHNPALPVTPAEIADACIGAAKEGAAICHIHVREPDTGTTEHEARILSRGGAAHPLAATPTLSLT